MRGSRLQTALGPRALPQTPMPVGAQQSMKLGHTGQVCSDREWGAGPEDTCPASGHSCHCSLEIRWSSCGQIALWCLHIFSMLVTRTIISKAWKVQRKPVRRPHLPACLAFHFCSGLHASHNSELLLCAGTATCFPRGDPFSLFVSSLCKRYYWAEKETEVEKGELSGPRCQPGPVHALRSCLPPSDFHRHPPRRHRKSFGVWWRWEH